MRGGTTNCAAMWMNLPAVHANRIRPRASANSKTSPARSHPSFQHFNARLSTLDAERSRLATVLDQMTDGVLIADAQGIIQFANPAAGRLFQTSQPVNRSIAEVVRHHQLVEAWRRCQQTRQMQSESVEVPTRHQYLQLVVVPDQHASGSLLLVQDLTRIRRLETVRRDFVSNLSHELRTPLASLKALTETLQDGALDDPPAARHFIDQIQIETDALTQMVTELLELSRIESGRFTLDLIPAAPCDLLDSASRRMQLQAERAGLNLRVDCPTDLPNVTIDSQQTGTGAGQPHPQRGQVHKAGGRSGSFRRGQASARSDSLFGIRESASQWRMSHVSSNGSIGWINPERAAGPGWDCPSQSILWKRTRGAFGRRARKVGGARSTSRFPSLKT